MTAGRRFAWIAACLAAWMVLAVAAPAAESLSDLRREKARLTETKRKAEKAAAELAETMRRESTSRSRMGELESRLAKQRRLIVGIDRRLAALGGQMDRAEREVRAIEEEKGRAQRGMSATASTVFASDLGKPCVLTDAAICERRRYIANRILTGEVDRYGRLAADKEEKERALSVIERRLEVSERRMAQQKKVGEKLASQQETERRRLAELEKRKKDKAKELRALRARIARMESLVSRIERRMKARVTRKPGPTRFSAVPGGLAPPLAGRVVGRFGKQRDPLFDVEVESRGVEIEAESGAVIHAVGGGEVVFEGSVSGFGKVLILQHGSGLFSVYGKADRFTVKQGQAVAAREAVGKLPVNPGGKSVLYLELRAAGTAIDPATVIPLSR